MMMAIEFNIEKAVVLYQESPPCMVTFVNSGPETIRVPRPVGKSTLLAARIVEVKTGIETVHRKARPGGRPPVQPILEPLEPGKKLQGRFLLSDLMPLPLPGEYEVSLLCSYNYGRDQAESPPVSMTVKPTTARNLSLVGAHGGTAAILYGAWVNLGPDPPDIVRSCFEVVPGGGVSETIAIAKGTLRTRPVLSSPPNGQVDDSHWVAWLDGRALKYTHFDPRLGQLKIGKVNLGYIEAEIVAPVFSDVTEDSSVRPGGAALLLTPSAGNTFRLTNIELAAGKALISGKVDLPGKRPCWIQTLARSNGSRIVMYMQTIENTAELYYVSWPERGAASRSAAKRLFQWRGQFVGAGATIDDEDFIRGATLIWVGERAAATLEVVGWRISPKGVFSLASPGEEAEDEPEEDELEEDELEEDEPEEDELEEDELEEDSEEETVGRLPSSQVKVKGQFEVERCIVRANDEGDVAALLLDSQGQWHVYDGYETKLLPDKWAATKLPVDIAFLGGGDQPVLICADLGRGFRIIQLNGKPLPPRRRP